ncbi:Late embryogenesis abundant (LEA) hydroxyproline-rich glycoprotein family [Arabidopsis thaliana]|jgi:hypothetical protein|uniref:Late embryogenesis abundant (LEA) hydroxyproline-rich glycoprotein family n=2 Tax=Arabidopsis thaliana TaxID=3702 RepID=Q84VP8_ARATH|nr:Late embryogenesis abundant (LEA) hydroxyproline-rich glycoprotein family [Arabidopsis thaliana]AAO73890.1 hypothetical protein [Arabidopsis thaliana]AAU44554.1 hypothetical protein AT5G21130 [Arabidopsis thaliana]AED92938.1 Late embryogenesis abundant (LEA) hydroxyproline-rich glycoprotein family [Arabidopsis thaliana]CAA0404001.1 unnamed protein product [Arabidopsis thaliana]|eukprot:NP_197612.1 Late embryogenesis abundant (LEA) hydroxyproline-rich glycoprotein family [Arabidopsis thaliana]
MTVEKPQEMTGDTNSDGFLTNKDVHRIKHPSLDTNDSSSSRYSVDSQKSRIGPPPGTYVIKLPKDQIYRVPPPENAHRYEYLSRRKTNKSCCRRCLCYSLSALLIIIVLAAIAFGFFYLVYQPHKPQFSVSGVSVTGINLTSSSPFSPVIRIKLRSQNVKGKLGLIYEKGNEADVFFNGTKLGNGEFTAFKQPAGNVTVIVTVLKGSSVKLKSSSRKELTESQKKGKVPFGLRIKAPVKFKVGSVTTWTMTITVDCKITVDKLTASATVKTENCETGLSLL